MPSDTIFKCPVCQIPVTKPLQPLPANQTICLEDGKDAVPSGFFAQGGQDFWTQSEGCVLVNLSDLTGTRRHTDSKRLNGCCGMDGCDGLNLLCEQGHEVATEKSDCWMSHGAVLVRNVIRATLN